jgi:GxxExxY protein
LLFFGNAVGAIFAVLHRPMLVEATFNVITHQIIGAAIEVHRILGPGLLESTYMPCLQYELAARKLRFLAERPVPVVYKGMELDTKYRIDLLVEDVVIVEVKSIDSLLTVHQSQVLTYMRLTQCPAGLLINFNVAKLIDGVKGLVSTRR